MPPLKKNGFVPKGHNLYNRVYNCRCQPADMEHPLNTNPNEALFPYVVTPIGAKKKSTLAILPF